MQRGRTGRRERAEEAIFELKLLRRISSMYCSRKISVEGSQDEENVFSIIFVVSAVFSAFSGFSMGISRVLAGKVGE